MWLMCPHPESLETREDNGKGERRKRGGYDKKGDGWKEVGVGARGGDG